MSAALSWLAVLACTLPIALTACVIVNINGSMDSELARSCLELDRQAKGTACPPCQDRDKSAMDVKVVGEATSTRKASANVSSEDSTSSPQLRSTIFVFISGFSFALGLILIVLLRLGDPKVRRAQTRTAVRPVESSSESSLEGSTYRASSSSVRAEHGSNQGQNYPYRASAAEARARQQDRQVSGQHEPPDLPAHPQPRGFLANRSESSRVCRETAFTSTPAPSMVELRPEEFWL